MTNPLLETDNLLPAFDRIQAKHVEEAIDYLLKDNREKIKILLEQNETHTWEDTLAPLEDIDERLGRAWSPASHLHAVVDNEELRKSYNACIPKLSEYSTEMGQNEDLFQAYKQVAESEKHHELDEAQKKIIENALRDFRLSGIDLNKDDQKQFKQLQQALSELQTKFEENLLDASHAWNKLINNEDELKGLPESARALAKQMAEQANKDGWLLTLDFPSYFPVMQYAENAELRREIYEAYVTRASELGPHAGKWDNSQLMLEILQKRHALASLLGFKSYAHRSLATKMASDPGEVIDFLQDLAEKSKPMAKQEYKELCEFANNQYGIEKLKAWDINFYSEKLKEEKYHLTQEELRPYFPMSQVLEGLFSVVNRLYGINITRRTDIAIWHEDVQFFVIHDSRGEERGSFYIDLYARQHKRGGAWMDECIIRKRAGEGIQNPVAYLTCNFTPPIGQAPALLTHDEVITLFHEFGHGLHHMLTRVDYAGVSGINGVAWDAVELPSQFMENWCWEREALDLIAKHHETGETIDDVLYEKMRAAKNFQSGMQMLRQLEFALFDFRLHLEYDENRPTDIQALINEVRNQIAVIQPPENNRFQHSFSHIFAGGYAAGYYSYKWAEILSADAFSKFEEQGIFNPETGAEFLHNILEKGGSSEPMDLFVAFRGRKPSVEPLLRHSGITS